MESPRPPLALLRSAATFLPRPAVGRVLSAVLHGLEHTHPRLISNLARLEAAVVHITPTDLPYRFALGVGRLPVTLTVATGSPPAADAEITARVATLVELLEGRIDSDSLFFRRDLVISGNTAVVVGLRNVLDREELNVAEALGALCGPLRRPARYVATSLDRVLDRLGARIAAMHRTLHPPATDARDVSADLERCHAEIGALTARLATLEARQQRREGRAP